MRVIYRSASKLRLHSSFYSWIILASNRAASIFVAKVGQGAITRFFFALFAWMIFASCLPLEIFAILLTWLYSTALVPVVRWLEPDAEDISVQESGSFGIESDEHEINSQLVTLVVTLEGPPPNVDLLQERVGALVKIAEDRGGSKLKQRLHHRLGCRVWKKDVNFHLSHHVHVTSNRWRGVILNEDSLRYWVDDFCNGLLPCNHPPWQVAVVPFQDDSRNENHVFVVRIHRVLVPFLKLSDILTDCQPVNVELRRAVAQALTTVNREHHDDNVEFHPPHDLQSIILLVKRNFETAKKILRLAWIAPRILYTELLCSCRYFMPRHYFKRKGVKRSNVYFWSDDFSQSLIRKIRDESMTNTNSVLISCLSGALKHYYGLTGERTPDDLLAYIPLYDRAPLALDESSPNEYHTLAMPMGKGDPLSRLQAIRSRLLLAESFPVRQELSRVALKYASTIFPPVLMRIATDFITRKYLAVINNVYVSDTSGQVLGKKAINVIYWRPLLNNIGISLSLMRYDDKVTLSVMGKRESLQRPDLLMNCFKRELYDLALALNVRMERKPTPPSSPIVKNF